ncbi:MAG TPA: 2-dehydro-3-deoxy-6-phosphogalactonate aldolase [Allosphingosinicella sp.]|nr:2-dehydro-3-deoxy-6-phosphogalactonate aldolase [Allosphingosinicella sp.]
MNPLLAKYLGLCPLVAIIRGVTPDQAEAVGEALFAGGIRIIEVPLNSPEPLVSIRRLVGTLGERALIGAGTVLNAVDVARVAEEGGRLIVSPNTDEAVIAATVTAGLVSCPGFFTPTEAIAALRYGAHALKLFPAEAASPAVIKAQRAVLPREVPLLVVGGIAPDTMRPWLEAGASGFGLGSGLYKPGQRPEEVKARARAYVAGLGR